MEISFKFAEIERIMGPEIDLVVTKRCPSNKEKDYVPAYHFSMVLHGTDMEVGTCDLRIGHNRNTYFGGNLGYGVNERFRGSHYAAKACLLMRELALFHGLDYLVITTNPDNLASRKTCENLGALLVEIADLPEDNEMYKLGYRKKCRYRWELVD